MGERGVRRRQARASATAALPVSERWRCAECDRDRRRVGGETKAVSVVVNDRVQFLMLCVECGPVVRQRLVGLGMVIDDHVFRL